MSFTKMGNDYCPKCSKKLNAATSAFGEHKEFNLSNHTITINQFYGKKY